MRKSHFIPILLFCLILYPTVVVTAYYTQHHVIFRSRGASFNPPGSFPVKEAYLPTPDGETLYAWWLETQGARRTVLFFQGNGRNLSANVRRLATFAQMKVNALMIDYRGFGRSTGRIEKEQEIYIDGRTAWNYLVMQKGIDPQSIIVWGRSLGGAVAAEIAQHRSSAGLVMESTFYSMRDVAAEEYWFLPTGLLLKFHFANGDKLRHVRVPVLIIHSVDDGYIPFSQATALFQAANPPRLLVRTTGSHLDRFDENPETVSALERYLGLVQQTARIRSIRNTTR